MILQLDLIVNGHMRGESMQNNKISLTALFLVSFLCVSAEAKAQEIPVADMAAAEIKVEAKPTTDTVIPPIKAELTASSTEKNTVVSPIKAETVAGVSDKVPSNLQDGTKTNKVQTKTEEMKPVTDSFKRERSEKRTGRADIQNKINSVREENKIRLEEELKNTSVGNKTIVDFPNRPTLGALELAPLPGISETPIGGPLPMAPSVSGKDLPSEQLLGRITPEVFQEMADLERGNTFLKLQLEKEKLKNDLEKLKATYRSTRLDEISKRENVVRSRIQWWHEQEKLRLEIEKKQAEEEELSRKIAEQEENRDRLRAEAEQKMKNADVQTAVTPTEKNEETVAPVVEAAPLMPMEDLYTLDSIRGIGEKLSATLKSKTDGSVIIVKKDDILPSGHVVREIKKGVVTVAYGNRIDQLIFRPVLN